MNDYGDEAAAWAYEREFRRLDPVFEPVHDDPAYSVGRYTRQPFGSWIAAAAVCAIFAVPTALFSFSWLADAATRHDGGMILMFAANTALWASIAVLGWRLGRARVETDPFGITVVNTWRTYRMRWRDVDAVVFDGRKAITLLTKDRVIACGALRWDKRRSSTLPFAKPGAREPLDSAARWLEATRSYYSARIQTANGVAD